MGRNAQRRRAAKQATKPGVRTPRPVTTHAQRRLAVAMHNVQTLAEVEQMVFQATVANRPRIRTLLYALTRPHLPCCGRGQLAAKMGQYLSPEQHVKFCPIHIKALQERVERERVEIVQ